jgi:hypothetical protein
VGRAVSRGVARSFDTTDTNALTAGQETFSRLLINNVAGGGVSGVLRLTYFTARKTETITQVRVVSGSTAAGATPTVVRFGLYSVAANGDIALIASTANDTALLATINTAYTKALSASVDLVAGTRYAFGILVVSAATMPTFLCLATTIGGSELNVAPRISALIAGQADLPASVANASLSAAALAFYAVVLPA